jgi:ParB family chromosome partitioning protein
MTRRVLGRGLSALLSDAAASKGEELLEIDIDLIEPNSVQPRNSFDDNKIEELAQSIRSNGILQPLLVRRKGGQYQLVAGERRWRAAQKAGLAKVPAVVRDVADNKLLELALIENIQRDDLNPIEEAVAYKNLIETLGLTQELVAQRVGRDRTYITNFLRLLRLPEDVQQLLVEGQISVGHARALLGVDDADIQRRVARNVIEMFLSVRETEKSIKRIISGEKVGRSTKAISSPKQVDANVQAAETKLQRRFGTKVKIVPNTKGAGGKIEIEYYGDADLDRIYQLLMTQQEVAATA